MDIPIPKSDGRCASGGRPFGPGERIVSTISFEEGKWIRRDYAADVWKGPPEGVHAWWAGAAPNAEAKRKPADVGEALRGMYYDVLARGDRPDLAYVLALLLVRKRVLKLDESNADSRRLRCVDAKDGRTFDVDERPLSEASAARLQSEIDQELERRLELGDAPEAAAA